MSFIDHLEELRWRIIKILSSIIFGGILTFFFIDFFLELLLEPLENTNSHRNVFCFSKKSKYLFSIVCISISWPLFAGWLVRWVNDSCWGSRIKCCAPGLGNGKHLRGSGRGSPLFSAKAFWDVPWITHFEFRRMGGVLRGSGRGRPLHRCGLSAVAEGWVLRGSGPGGLPRWRWVLSAVISRRVGSPR